MNRTIIKHEFKMISRSKKNMLFILALVALILSYCLLILPEKMTPDSIDAEKTRLELKDLAAKQNTIRARGGTGFVPNLGYSPYADNQRTYMVKSRMLYAYEDQDWKRYLNFKVMDFDRSGFEMTLNEMRMGKSPFPGKDLEHLRAQTTARYSGYLEKELPVTYKMIEQKTALQQLQNFLLGSGPLFLLFAAIYFSSDVLSRDRQNQTVLQGFPIGWYQLINLKSLVAYLYTMTVLFGLLALAMLILTLLNGFGSFEINMLLRLAGEADNLVFGRFEYETITLGKYLLMTLAFLPILVYLFVRLSMLLSLVFKNGWLVLMTGSAFLFCELIYRSRTTREVLGIKISNLPQTYFEFGKLYTREKNFLINMETITYEKGLLVIGLTIVVVECMLLVASRFFNKRRFYQGI